MATVIMREIRPGEVPFDGGTAIQDDPTVPVFQGNGEIDYVCVTCGNVLAVRMQEIQMTKKVRIRCARCATVNVSAPEPGEEPERPRKGP
jgi:DNA-directed RNA polymerase subunit RPC12/RpoP